MSSTEFCCNPDALNNCKQVPNTCPQTKNGCCSINYPNFEHHNYFYNLILQKTYDVLCAKNLYIELPNQKGRQSIRSLITSLKSQIENINNKTIQLEQQLTSTITNNQTQQTITTPIQVTKINIIPKQYTFIKPETNLTNLLNRSLFNFSDLNTKFSLNENNQLTQIPKSSSSYQTLQTFLNTSHPNPNKSHEQIFLTQLYNDVISQILSSKANQDQTNEFLKQYNTLISNPDQFSLNQAASNLNNLKEFFKQRIGPTIDTLSLTERYQNRGIQRSTQFVNNTPLEDLLINKFNFTLDSKLMSQNIIPENQYYYLIQYYGLLLNEYTITSSNTNFYALNYDNPKVPSNITNIFLEMQTLIKDLTPKIETLTKDLTSFTQNLYFPPNTSPIFDQIFTPKLKVT